MGLNYSYLFLSRVETIDSLLSALASIASPDVSARLNAALPWTPHKVLNAWSNPRAAQVELKIDVKGLAPLSDNCLVLLFPPDGVIASFDPEEKARWWQPWKRRHVPRPEPVDIGCIDLTLRAGAVWAGVWLTAVTSEMSRCFEDSSSIRRTFVEVAHSAGAACLLLDLEDDYRLILPPGPRFDPEYEKFVLNDDTYEPDMDLFAAALLARSEKRTRD